MPTPRGLVQRLDQFLHRSRLLRPGQRLLVACSGGADSVALLRLLHAVNRSDYWGWTLAVGHVNHQLRGEESAGDAAFVKALAKELGLKYTCRKVRVKRTKGGVASEGAAREARYGAIKRMMKQKKCEAVVVGHHAEDQAETILLRMLRGCGVMGLKGMAANARIGGLLVVRPLLGIGREELRAYLLEMGQLWREDASNETGDYLRNRVRREVMPALVEMVPQLGRAMGKLALNARLAGATLDRMGRRVLERAMIVDAKGGMLLDRAQLRRVSLELRRLALRRAMIKRGARGDGIDFERLLEAAREIRKRPAGTRKYEFAGGVEVVIDRESVMVQGPVKKGRKG